MSKSTVVNLLKMQYEKANFPLKKKKTKRKKKNK